MNSISNWGQLGRSPNQTIHLHSAYQFLHLLHVSFIVPRFTIENNIRLSYQCWFCTLLFIIFFNKFFFLFLPFFSFLLLLIIKQINVIVVVITVILFHW